MIVHKLKKPIRLLPGQEFEVLIPLQKNGEANIEYASVRSIVETIGEAIEPLPELPKGCRMSFHRFMAAEIECADYGGYGYSSTRYKELISWTAFAPVVLVVYFVIYLVERRQNKTLPPKIF